MTENGISRAYIQDGWLRCPCCRRKLFPVGSDTVIHRLSWLCKRCHSQIEIDILKEPEPVSLSR